MSPIETLTGKPLKQFLRDNGLLMAGVAIIIMSWILIYTFAVYEPKYAAKSMVIIKDSAITSRYVEPDQYYALQTTSSNSANPVLNTMGLLKSNSISDALWEYFKTKRPAELKKVGVKTKNEWEQFFQDGTAFIKSKNMPGTDLIAIQFTWSNPVVAKEGLNVILKSFQDTSLTINKAEQISRSKFLHNQVNDISAQLDEVRKEKTQYKRRAGTVNIGRESDGLAGTKMELGNKLNQLESQAQGKLSEVGRYQQMLGMSPEQAIRAAAIGQNSALSKLQDELYRLSQQYANLSTNLTDTNPKVLEIKAQIEQVKQDIEFETLRTLGSSQDRVNSAVADGTRGTMVSKMVEAQAEATRYQAEADVLQKRINQINQQIAVFPAMEEELTNIQQREASLSNALDVLRQKVLEARLKEEQTLSNVFIVDTPMTPSKADFPNQTHLVILSVVLGLAGGLASGVIKEQLAGDRKLGTPQWLQAIDEEDDEEAYAGYQLPTPAPMQVKRENRAPTMPQQAQQPVVVPMAKPGSQPVPQAAPNIAPLPAIAVATGPAIVKQPAVVGSLYDTLMAYNGPVRKPGAEPVRRELPKPVVQQAPAASVPVQPVEKPVVSSLDVIQAVNNLQEKPAAQPEKAVAADKPQTEKPTLEEVAEAAFVPAEEAAEAEFPKAAKTKQRVRSLPAFLMDDRGNPAASKVEEYPIGLSRSNGKKALLSAKDDLMQEVTPLTPPASLKAGSRIPAFLLNGESEPVQVDKEIALSRLQKQYLAGITSQKGVDRHEVANRKYSGKTAEIEDKNIVSPGV